MERTSHTTQRGFTIMEIVVATAIFAVAVSAMMSLLNYTLKINRRTEALRQATQGMRNFVEFLVKEIRNGQVDYSVYDDGTVLSAVDPCPMPTGATVGAATNGGNSYNARENRLGLVNLKGERECFYLASGDKVNPAYVGTAQYWGKYLMLKKGSLNPEDLTPQYFTVQELQFFIQPLRSPYHSAGSGYAKAQPSVTIAAKFAVELPTKEKVDIYYQTTVSTNKYDVPK